MIVLLIISILLNIFFVVQCVLISRKYDEEILDLIGCGVNIGSRWSKQNTIEKLEKIKAKMEFEKLKVKDFNVITGIEVGIDIIGKELSELKGE